MNTDQQLKNYIKARYALLVIESYEEERVVNEIAKVAKELNQTVYVWNSTDGVMLNGVVVGEKTFDLKLAIDYCESLAKEPNSRNLFVFCDAHNYLDSKSNPIYRRRLKDFLMNIRRKGYISNCIIVSPSFEISNDLQKEVTILDFPLPDRNEVKEIINSFIRTYGSIPNVKTNVDNNTLENLIDASIGLTKLEIENCLSRIIVSEKRIDKTIIRSILEEKKQIIRKTGILEFVESNLNLEDVGGLENLKRWLHNRKCCFENDAKQFGIRAPKGVLLTGIPGCGKSLTAKCISTAWSMPLLRLDMGKIFQGLVGSSESNIRLALKTAEAISPSILWIDEIEKGLSGASGGGGDGGTSVRVFGTLLTWMQEKTSPVFVFATANNINSLPPELLRKGRFDEIFFVDFPSSEERKKILEIHISKLGRNKSDFDLDRLAKLSGESQFGKDVVLAGAELEAWVSDALIQAFSRRIEGEQNADLSMKDFEATIKRVVPMGQMRKDEFMKIREWANENAVSASLSHNTSNGFVQSEEFIGGRKLDF
jgi:ATP-dependent 26S proteasome regulatory subunit